MIVRPEIESYLCSLASRHDEAVVCDMEEEAARRGFPIVGRLCGVALELLARAVGARRIFELGSGYGYSGYWFARAVGPSGEVHLTDADPANEARAKEYLTRAGLWGRIRYHVGDALTSFEAVDGDFDVVYCDVDKEGYPDCWRAARKRIRPGGLWIADNALWSGRVLDANPDPATAAIAEHNRLVASDAAFLSAVIPIRDGLMVALRVA